MFEWHQFPGHQRGSGSCVASSNTAPDVKGMGGRSGYSRPSGTRGYRTKALGAVQGGVHCKSGERRRHPFLMAFLVTGDLTSWEGHVGPVLMWES